MDESEHEHEHDDDSGFECFGCNGSITEGMDTFVSEPCPDILGNQHAWHIQCFMCHKMHGAFPNMPRCEAPKP